MERSILFVTGMQRCGSTLLNKLLSAHSQISILSQPFPFLFIEAKRAFLRSLGRGDAEYPLGNLFIESGYLVEEFAGYLRHHSLDHESLLSLFAEMRDFSGQYTRFEEARVKAGVHLVPTDDFARILSSLYVELTDKRGARSFGGKETMCEEFLPYLLDRGWKCLIIVRDPRDIMASLNYGQGQNYGGRLKPTLFNLRNWRKSIAFVLHLRNHPGFMWLRYEDLVTHPMQSLNRLAEELGVGPFTENLFDEGVKNQKGDLWQSNSSHSPSTRINRSSVEKYKSTLPPEVVSYVEACCYPEMRYLNYPLSIGWDESAEAIKTFEDPYEIGRETLRNYYLDAMRNEEELQRIELLSTAEEVARDYFIFEDIVDLLRGAIFK